MRAINRLTATGIRGLSARGLYGDGNGLYLQISAFGSKSWVYRYQRDGAARMMGLGSVNTSSVAAARQSLSGARERAQEAHEKLLRGIDPIDARRSQKQEERLAKARILTFRECAERYIKAHSAGWKNEKHAWQWPKTLEDYVYPFIGELSVADIDTALVLKCLEPIWQDKTETATRVRGRIESVLDYAKAHSYRTAENPARWRGHLDKLLVKPTEIHKVEHHAALRYKDIPHFMAELRQQRDHALAQHAPALEFTILTAARKGEVVEAKWGEIDFAAKLWNVPAEHMKRKRPHTVPLSDRAVLILKSIQPAKCNDGAYVFPGPVGAMSSNGMRALLLRLRPDLTVHGFRSTFRDWAGDQTNFPRDIVETALAHQIEDATEATYRRSDALEKRRKLMDAWAGFCSRPATGDVVQFRKGSA
jgi:integrase